MGRRPIGLNERRKIRRMRVISQPEVLPVNIKKAIVKKAVKKVTPMGVPKKKTTKKTTSKK